MRYSEFEDAVWDISDKYNIYENENSVTVEKLVVGFTCRVVAIDTVNENVINLFGGALTGDDLEVLKLAIELVETPLEEREDKKKYYLCHKWAATTTSGLSAHLFKRLSDNLYFIGDRPTRGEGISYQTEFTKKEIEEIKDYFEVSLDGFELYEVEED